MIDLFSGCGGLSLGLKQAGFNVVFASDIEQVCADTYVKNFGIPKDKFFTGDINVLIENYGDYKHLFSDIDLVCGGPPCQGFSMANRQRMIDDPRNELYRAFLKFVKLVNPKFFIMENVKGMKNKAAEVAEDFVAVLEEEYSVAYRVINARNFGVPQNRERLFLIGNRLGVSSELIFDKIAEPSYPHYNLRDAISDLPSLGRNVHKNNTSIENDVVGYRKVKYNYEHTQFRSYINNNRQVEYLYNHRNRYNNERDVQIFSLLPQGENSLHESIAHIMPYTSRNHIFKDKYYKLKYDDVSKTITAHMKHDCNMYIHPEQARGLSPREAARVQTFPDDFVFCGAPNSWYMQIGNAVPVKLAEAIGIGVIEWL